MNSDLGSTPAVIDGDTEDLIAKSLARAADLHGNIVADITPVPLPGDSHRFLTTIPDAWRIFYAFGGATMAAAIRAATVAVDRPDLHMVSCDATFCQAIPTGPVISEVEILRQGRTAAQVLVYMWAVDPTDPDFDGPRRSDLVLTCVFGQHTVSPVSFAGTTMPETVAPEDCETPRNIDPDSPFANLPYHQQVEMRFMHAGLAFDRDFEPTDPHAMSWYRFRERPDRGDGIWDPAALALPGDVLGPAVHAGAGGRVGHFLVISLQISMQFMNPVQGEWLLQDTRAHIAGDGYATGTATLWGETGELAAIATQCARLQPIKM